MPVRVGIKTVSGLIGAYKRTGVIADEELRALVIKSTIGVPVQALKNGWRRGCSQVFSKTAHRATL
jgi:hypothetical protein